MDAEGLRDLRERRALASHRPHPAPLVRRHPMPGLPFHPVELALQHERPLDPLVPLAEDDSGDDCLCDAEAVSEFVLGGAGDIAAQ